MKTPICQFDPAPIIIPGVVEKVTIYGAYDKWVNQNDYDNFDPLEGVYAKNALDEDVPVIATLVSDDGRVKVYEYMATSGSKTDTKTRHVYLWGNPTIYAPGQIIYQGDSVNLMDGVTATDFDGNDITNQVKYSGTYDVNVPGDYTITYTVDSHGFTDTTTATLTVLPWAPPVITAPAVTEIELGGTFDPMANVSAVDFDGTDITSDVVWSGRYETDKVGTYTIIYTVTDVHGRSGSAMQRLVVKPAQKATFLFADGTLIINGDRDLLPQYKAEHGSLTAEYLGGPYNFTREFDVPWYSRRQQVKKAEFGTPYKPTSLAYTFAGLENMTEVDLTNLDSSECTDFSNMFYYCFKLQAIDATKIDVTNGVNFRGMFLDCWEIQVLDCSGWDTSNGENFQAMFYDCVELRTIYAKPTFVTPQDAYMTNTMFSICQNLSGGNGTQYDSNYIDYQRAWVDAYNGHAGYFTDKDWLVTTLYEDGTLVINEPSTQRVANMALHGKVMTQYGPATAENNWQHNWAGDSRIKKAQFATAVKPVSMSGWFSGCTGLEEIDWTNLDSSDCTDMSSLFNECSSMRVNDLSQLDTSKVTNFSGMFRAMKPFDGFMEYVNAWDTSSGVNFASMFSGMKGLDNITIAFDTSNGTNFNSMFGYSEIKTVDIKEMDMSSAEMTHFMFGVMPNLTTIYSYCPFSLPSGTATLNMFTNSFNLVGGMGTTYSVTDGSYAKCDGGSGDPGYFTRVRQGRATTQFYDGTLIINEVIADRADHIAAHGRVLGEYDPPPYYFDHHGAEPWNTAIPKRVEFGPDTKPPNMDYWFSSNRDVTEFDWTNLDTSECTSMEGTFYACDSLRSVDLTGLDTSNVTSMRSMFMNSHYLTTVEGLTNTSSVTDFSNMFYDCWYVRDIPTHMFNTSQATTFRYMFANCRELEGVGCGRWDTSRVTVFSGMFFGCQKLRTAYMRDWNTTKARDMSQMFQGCYAMTDIRAETMYWTLPDLEDASEMFRDCTGMVYISLAWINPNRAFKARRMFFNCNKCEKILSLHDWTDFPGWATIDSTDMFAGCIRIKGQGGTTYSSAAVDGRMARLDSPPDNRAYFSHYV